MFPQYPCTVFPLMMALSVFQMIHLLWVPALSCSLIFVHGVPLGSCCMLAIPANMDLRWGTTSVCTFWGERWGLFEVSVTVRLCSPILFVFWGHIYSFTTYHLIMLRVSLRYIYLNKYIYFYRLWHKLTMERENSWCRWSQKVLYVMECFIRFQVK